MLQKAVFAVVILFINLSFTQVQSSSSCENTKLANAPQIERFQFTPDGNHLIYAAGHLYKASLNGENPPIQISGDDENRIGFFTFTPDYNQIVYVNAFQHVFITQYEASISQPLNPNQTLNQGISELTITPDSRHIIYRTSFELYSVPIDGSSDPVMLNNPVPGNPIGNVEVSPDSRSILYAANENRPAYDLYKVPIDRSSEPTNLTIGLPDILSVDFVEFSPDNQHITFTARERQGLTSDTYTMPLDGTDIPKKIEPLKTGVVIPDGRYIINIVYDDKIYKLQKMSVTDNSPPVTLDQSLPGSIINRFKISPDGTYVIYDKYGHNASNLYSVLVDGSKSPVLLDGNFPSDGGVLGFYYGKVTTDSKQVVYISDREGEESYSLTSVAIDGSTSPVILDDNIFIDDNNSFDTFLLTNNHHILYRIQDRKINVIDLYGIPLYGGLPIKINNDLPPNSFVFQYNFSPNTNYIVYTVEGGKDTELYSAYCPFQS
ncbi:MAG: hypothetical protein ABI690_27535 [Chloroflexota bacterium]